jgi:phosphoribosylformylglycinamidine cyclo-ligase
MTTYEERGASSFKPDVVKATEQTYKGIFPNAFCRAVPDVIGGSDRHCFLLHADGAGTKSSLAYLYYRQYDNLEVFKGIAQDSLVMNLDDLLCVGATGPFVLSNTIGRNAKLIDGEIVKAIITGYEECIAKLKQYNIEITTCGGETADVGDLVRTVIVDSVLACRLPKENFIDCGEVRMGQDIVGLASFGKAIYEERYNSGISTNGFTTVRHELLSQRYKTEFPESFAPDIADLAYTGKFDLASELPGSDFTVGEALLSPTRTYAPIVAQILQNHKNQISAIFHNSGGGQAKCLNFGNNIRYVKDNLFPLPPIFDFIQAQTNLTYREMCRTLNLGHRMEIVCDPEISSEIIAISQSFGVDAQIIGRTEPFSEGVSVIINTPTETIEFTRQVTH